MRLSTRCQNDFSFNSRQRGEEYFRADQVRLTKTAADGVSATVAGSRRTPYQVEIDWSEADTGVIRATCACPHYADGFLCKHLWATLLQIESEGLDQHLAGASPLGVLRAGDADPTDYEDPDADLGWPALHHLLAKAIVHPAPKAAGAPWQRQLSAMCDLERKFDRPRHSWGHLRPREREVWYALDIGACRTRGVLLIDLLHRERKRDGQFGKIKRLSIRREDLEGSTEDEDQQLLQMIVGGASASSYAGAPYYYTYESYSNGVIPPAMYDLVLPRLCATGRFVWTEETGKPLAEDRRLQWDDGDPWRFAVVIDADEARQHWRLNGRLQRDGETVPLAEPLVLLRSGLVVFRDRLARLAAQDEFAWIGILRQLQGIEIPYRDRSELLEQLCSMPPVSSLALPGNLRVEEVRLAPAGKLAIHAPSPGRDPRKLFASVSFRYGETTIDFDSAAHAHYDHERERVLLRDRKGEQALVTQLAEAGAQPYTPPSYGYGYQNEKADVQLHQNVLPKVVDRLTRAGWIVEAEGRQIRRAGHMRLGVTSGIDWFELRGELDFDGITATFPQLLSALRKGERYLRLGDGSQGLLPEEWISRYGALTDLGSEKDGAIQFAPSQALLLDALLASKEQQIQVDRKFEALRDRLRSFAGITPRAAPRGFRGELRAYQKEGLGWLHFLREFGFGGCLADDMGLGKTIQILALLEARRKGNPKTGAPSLVVVPKSLVYNWIDEAARFTPKLRTLKYTGLERADLRDALHEHDLIITTYGTLRRDILQLKDVRFDYAILDEAQAIKNAASQSAKACRLLDAKHRLALTGTPIENHLGELWSLFEFLNPGILGRSRTFQGASRRGLSEDSLRMLAQGLKPFMLRRTKAQVLTELPEKTEQTLYCELGAKERKLYNELRDHYRMSLNETVAERGIKRSKIQVLEALLRLRQAACHPGLLDKRKLNEPSGKLESLLCQLAEVVEEGHKALVFSQFTSLLAIVRRQLDSQGRVYEYLDGRTRDRAARVRRFQVDADCPLFLISLKAGGQGLNLTAADYVFILDPWWNPAVEAQAVDRAHRLGQTRRVFAYRLIARDTVEEKIVSLQQEKRALADAIICADQSLIRKLTIEDLQILLS